MWQVVLFRTPRGGEIAEVLSIQETLLERPFRDRKKEKRNKTQTQSLRQSIYDDHILPVTPATIYNYCSPLQLVCKIIIGSGGRSLREMVDWWCNG